MWDEDVGVQLESRLLSLQNALEVQMRQKDADNAAEKTYAIVGVKVSVVRRTSDRAGLNKTAKRC